MKENLDLDEPTTVAVIIILIYGVCCVANQCEEVIKLLAEKTKEMYPKVTSFLLNGCYVDDLRGCTPSNEDSNKVIAESSESLGSISMKIKGFAISSSDPPEELPDDSVSVSCDNSGTSISMGVNLRVLNSRITWKFLFPVWWTIVSYFFLSDKKYDPLLSLVE